MTPEQAESFRVFLKQQRARIRQRLLHADQRVSAARQAVKVETAESWMDGTPLVVGGGLGAKKPSLEHYDRRLA